MPLLTGRTRSKRFLLVVGGATLLVMGLFATKSVTVKLLPFDNKSEFQVQIDLPEGSALEETERVLKAASARLAALPELVDIQAHAGTAVPFNFNGLVRHSYLRGAPELGELQVNLQPKGDRKRASHTVALDARRRLSGLPVPDGTAIKVVEVPPGPPVMATLLAEVYGPTPEARHAAAARVKQAFRDVPFVVDIDDSLGSTARRLRLVIDQEALEFHGVEEEAVFDTLRALFSGVSVGYSHRGHGTNPIEIAVRLPRLALTIDERLLSTPVLGAKGVVELGDVVRVVEDPSSPTVYRRDGRFADMVTAELAGAYEAPIYGMFAVEKALKDRTTAAPLIALSYHGQPLDEAGLTLLWDGEWEVTYVTFRDMGAAFGVALLAIYLLVVAQFGSFKVPLVILVPVLLTLIGIVLGHWLFGAPFSATSMIGFIALAAMIGAAFILADPIFQGLAISLVFGLASSTALTLLTIPAIYFWLRDDGKTFARKDKIPR